MAAAEALLNVGPEAQAAHSALGSLRGSIQRFNAERAKTRELVEGRRKSRFGQTLAAETITEARRRMAPYERTAVDQLRMLLGLVLGREPTAAEMVAVPELDPTVLSMRSPDELRLIAGGALSLGGLFDLLTSQETAAQKAAGMAPTVGEYAAKFAILGIPLVMLGAVGFGGYALYKEVRGESILKGAKKLFRKRDEEEEED